VVVDDLQTGELVGLRLGLALVVRALHVAEALDGLHEVTGGLRVRAVGGVVPGVDEVLRLDLGAVVELVALDQLDGEGLVVLGGDGLRDVVLGSSRLRVVVHQLGGRRVQNVATTGLGGVAGNQRVLGVAAPDGDRAAGLAASRRVGRVAALAATTGCGKQRGGGDAGKRSHRASSSSHGCPPT
jgi:hypothetical protein